MPYYRKLFDRHRLHPRHIRGVRDLDLIPISSKQDLRSVPAGQLLANGVDAGRLLTARTSGSSGEPFVIRRTWLEDKRNHLLRLRSYASMGVSVADRRVALGVVRPRDPNDRKLIGRMLRTFGIAGSRKLDGLQEPELILGELRRIRPHVLSGMPGILCRFADYLASGKEPPIQPRMLIVGGEVLTSVVKRRLTEVFGAPVRNTCASHEFPLLASECLETGELHTCDDGVILEVLHQGRPARPGEQGEAVITSLNAFAMPFIRYRLGDIITMGEERCRCGRAFSTIRQVQGRTIDSFSLPDGRVIHPYQLLTRFIAGGDKWIRQYQLLQERKDYIVLRVVPTITAVSEHLSQVERAVRPLLGPAVEFRVQLLDHIPLDHTGKFRSARSLVAAASLTSVA